MEGVDEKFQRSLDIILDISKGLSLDWDWSKLNPIGLDREVFIKGGSYVYRQLGCVGEHTFLEGDRPGRSCASIRRASSISLRVLFFRRPLGHSHVTFDLRHALKLALFTSRAFSLIL